MATTIRLARHGAKKSPFYRIVVADSRSPRDGSRLDQVGTYDPLQNPEKIVLDEEKLSMWLGKGARPSETVSQLMKRSGFTTGKPVAAVDPGEAQT